MQLWIAAGQQPQAYNPQQFVVASIRSNLTDQTLYSYTLSFSNNTVYYSSKGYATTALAASAGLAILQSAAATVQLD